MTTRLTAAQLRTIIKEEAAAEELRNAVSVALDGVVDKLYDGVYAR
jgi:hypothetical protein